MRGRDGVVRVYFSFHTVQSLSVKNDIAGPRPPLIHSIQVQVPSRSATESTITSVNLFLVILMFSKCVQTRYHGFPTFPKLSPSLTPLS